MKKFLLSFVLTALFSLVASGKGELEDFEKDKNTLILTGRIEMRNPEPFANLTLTTEDGIDYALTGEKALELEKRYQLRLVRIKGVEEEKDEILMAAKVKVLDYKILDE